MAHIRLYHKDSGQHVDVWSVDAAELLASGEYVAENPETGMQEGVPGETVMRPFDPTMHREHPESVVGDMVVTTPPPGGTPQETRTVMPGGATQATVMPRDTATAREATAVREATVAREAAERAEAARKK